MHAYTNGYHNKQVLGAHSRAQNTACAARLQLQRPLALSSTRHSCTCSEVWATKSEHLIILLTIQLLMGLTHTMPTNKMFTGSQSSSRRVVMGGMRPNPKANAKNTSSSVTVHWKHRSVVGAVKWKADRAALLRRVIEADVTQKAAPDTSSSDKPI